MTRLGPLNPAVLDESQRRLYQDITGGPRAQAAGPDELVDRNGALSGPFNAMLLQPTLGSALQALGAAIRYQGGLGGRARELAILAVAAHWECGFEQHVHEAAARRLGLAEADLAMLRAGREPPLADPAERAAVRAAQALAGAGDLDDEQYAEAAAALGTSGVFELTTLVGYYATLALQLRVFRVGRP
ncbi:MAG TPA: carboxymuconolactone decarboxylase family protein [Streptosporangiaceae bacterium]|nr:carboxymuconolactone decarboxylase family protein [Streptosporangiaceae bacterium]